MIEEFKKIYSDINGHIKTSFCPYRICPVGAHIDHQKGIVTGFAINKGVTITYVESNDSIVEISSLNFEGKKIFSVIDVQQPNHDWADYLRGVAKILHERFNITKGLFGLIKGTIPVGGLSSSAAVTISFMKCLCDVNNIKLEQSEIVKLAQEVENKYIGVNSGTLDQSCEIYCKKDHLLYLDTLTGEYQLIPQNPNMKEYEIAIFFSGVERTLVGSAYNTRVDELKSAAYSLKAYADMPYGKFNETVLRDVDEETFNQYGDKLPINFYKRAKHYFSEMNRVHDALNAWKKGYIEAFGQIMFASGDSSINNYEAGSKELIALHQIMKETDGIYGGRFSGAGFKGSCIALIDPTKKETIAKYVTETYLSKFPNYKDSFEIHFCQTADGCDFNN